MLTTSVGARTVAAIGGLAIGIGAASAVAYSATRPPSEVVMVAPADQPATPDKEGDDSGTAVGPDATGPAAFGLCNAWANHHKHDDGVERAKGSVAMRNLAAAAGGEDKVAAYCASIPHPGKGPKSGKGPHDKKDKGDKGDKARESSDADDQDETSEPSSPAAPTQPDATPSASPSPEASQSPLPTPTESVTPSPSPPSPTT